MLMGSRWRQMLLLGRQCRALLPSPTGRYLMPRAVRLLHATAGNCRFPGSDNGAPQGRRGGDGRGNGGLEGDLEGNDGQEEEEEELLESHLPPVPLGVQQVFIVHPAVKRAQSRAQLTTAELQLAEAVGLINSIPNWTILDKIIISTKNPDRKYVFGKGNFQLLTEKIKGLQNVSSVFLNVERLSPVTQKVLEEAWEVKVFDRYTIVLHIFRCNARTKEARLQIALAEIPLLRANIPKEVAQLNQQRGGSRYIMGSGETFFEMRLRLLKERELKIRRALEKLRRKRCLLRSQRQKREFPTISVMGYTNCGKTTLIKALTGDAGLQPRNQLFATLDITAHAGDLPSCLTVLYVDTIGFLSQLPHNLIESFSATLEDVAHSDLIVHVRDISHPETNLQKASVLSVLRNLNLPSQLLETMIEVHNKVDLIDGYHPTEPDAIPISALLGNGLEKLKEKIESTILKTTGKSIITINIDLSGPQLSWLYKEATVQEVNVVPEDGTANVKVIISNSALGKYKNLFPRSSYSS